MVPAWAHKEAGTGGHTGLRRLPAGKLCGNDRHLRVLALEIIWGGKEALK